VFCFFLRQQAFELHPPPGAHANPHAAQTPTPYPQVLAEQLNKKKGKKGAAGKVSEIEFLRGFPTLRENTSGGCSRAAVPCLTRTVTIGRHMQVDEAGKLDKRQLMEDALSEQIRERQEAERKLNRLVKHMDHLERAMREAEVPLLKAAYAKQLKDDEAYHTESQVRLFIESMQLFWSNRIMTGLG